MGTYTPDDYNGPGYTTVLPVPLTPQILPPPQRNFTPPPRTPDTFTVSNTPGSQASHPMDPANLTPPTPGSVQTAQAPTPSQATEKPPTPAEYKPPQLATALAPPPAAPLPPLGGWQHADNVPPWVVPRTVLAGYPNREPDGYMGGRPVWNPRPGEAGYDAPRPRGARYTFAENLGLALQAGFKGPAAYTAAAIGMAESSGEAGQITYKDGGKPYNSYGLMQINGSNDALLQQAGIRGGAQAALNPLVSYQAAYILSKGGTDFTPWTMFNNGGYKQYLDTNAKPVDGHPIAGPVQNYRPPPERPPSQWGKEPEHDWKPGGMPQAHDVPGIMKSLLPLLLTVGLGFAGKGALGAITAFGAYQNARNKGQLEEAKQQRTFWQDHLKETAARLQEELIGAAGIHEQFPDQNSPEAQAAWQRLAANFEDDQLRAALASGDMGAVDRIFKARDRAFQNISKTSASDRKAEEQREQKEREDKEAGAAGFPPEPGGGGAPRTVADPGWPMNVPERGAAPQPAPIEPPQPQPTEPAAPSETPAPPTPDVRPPATGPAGVTPPQPGRTSPPAAAAPPSASPEEPPSSSEATPPAAPAAAPDAGGGRGDQSAAPGSQTTLPPVAVTAPAATPVAAAPQTPFDTMVSELVNGTSIDSMKGVPKDRLFTLQAAAARKIAQLNAVPAGPHAAEQMRAIDSTFGDYVAGVANYTMPAPTLRGTAGREYANNVYAAAQKINPQWNFANYKKQEEFADPKGAVQVRLTRASTMGEAAANVMKDAKILQDSGVEVTQDKISEAIDRLVNGLQGDPRYMQIANDILAFTQEDQALRTGHPSVTETEAQNTLVSGRIFLGSLEQIRTYVQRNIDTANAAITYYQRQWSQMQGPGVMPGGDPEANAIITSMKYLDPRTGQYHGLPKGFELPTVLRAGVPDTAPPPTVNPSTTAPPSATGGGGTPRVGPNGEGYEQVPKGQQYIGPDGKTYTKG